MGLVDFVCDSLRSFMFVILTGGWRTGPEGPCEVVSSGRGGFLS